MSIIVVQKKKLDEGFAVPDGGEILWYGTASQLPAGWSIDSAIMNNFVEMDNVASDTIVGSNSHGHTTPNTSTRGNHQHTHGGRSISNYDPTVSEYQASGQTTVAVPTHDHSHGTGLTSWAGEHYHTINDLADKTVLPPYAKYHWIEANGEQAVPVGGIIIWDDAIGNRPLGFELCNGSNGTPDLRDKFVMGAGGDLQIGDTGGVQKHTHTPPNTNTAGAHSHTVSGTTTGSNTKDGGYEGVKVQKSHSHSFNGTTSNDVAHDHTIGETGEAWNYPPYMRLYFIMRTV